MSLSDIFIAENLNYVSSLSVSVGRIRLAFRKRVLGISSSPYEIFRSSCSYSHLLAVFKGLPFGTFFRAKFSSVN